jgi:hypothetical protein
MTWDDASTGAPGEPTHPIYNPPGINYPTFPSNPIVVPPGGAYPGQPPGINYPTFPTNPIVVPPGGNYPQPPLGIWGGGNVPFPTPPIYYPPVGGGGGGTPPGIWGGGPHPMPPIFYPQPLPPGINYPTFPTNPIVVPPGGAYPQPEQPPGQAGQLPASNPNGGWVYGYVPGYGWMWAYAPKSPDEGDGGDEASQLPSTQS